MYRKGAYFLSALFLLAATTIGILAASTPAHASGFYCIWAWNPEPPFIYFVDCVRWHGDCESGCDQEFNICLDECEEPPATCIHECMKVFRECNKMCVPEV